jgi:hypothetical protein
MSVHTLTTLKALGSVGLIVGLAACGGTSGKTTAKRDPCFQSWPTAAPAHVTAGATVRLSAAGLRGDCRFKGSQTYRISLLRAADLRHPVTLGQVRVGPTGQFAVTVRIPSGTPTGSAELVVSGPQLDPKLACPPNALCRRYGAGIYVR